MSGATYNAANRQTQFGASTMTFDANGNLHTSTDHQGTTLTWDAQDRLAGLTRTADGLTAGFIYDGLGRRVSKTVNGVTTAYAYDGRDLLNTVTATGATDYLMGSPLDEPLARNGGTQFYLTDALGSVITLVDTTGAGDITYTYAPFGASTSAGVASANPLGFAGREADETGLYFNRARYYHPVLQRFISEDPIGFRGGDANLYAYVHNRPLNARDPSGLWDWRFHWGRTKQIAEDCGMTNADADIVAQADAAVDFPFFPLLLPSLSTLNPWSAKHAMPGTDWSNLFKKEFDDATGSRGDDPGGLKKLGQALHVIQDAWSHDLAGVGMGDHFLSLIPGLGVPNPDNAGDPANLGRAWAAERATKNAIRDFMKGRGDKPKC